MAFTFRSIRIRLLRARRWLKVEILLFNENNKTIVWTAYRGDPPVSSKAKLVLTMRGELLLQTGPGQKKVISHGGQVLTSGTELVSSSSDTSQSSGRFQFAMQSDGNLVLYPRYSGSTAGDAYWASDSYGGDSSKYYLFLNNTDPRPLCIINASSSNNKYFGGVIIATSKETTLFIVQLLILMEFFDSVHYKDVNRTHQVKMLWSPPELDNLCKVKTFCGFNSYCTINDNQPYCICLPGSVL
ncbi:hypothetical protein K1719_003425 [Acacia pycnantha]|nr:hypothetical protein K1719_003425 [Acacia pycnantha]